MNKVKNKNLIIGIVTFGMFLLLASLVSSFAVGSKYWEENPLLINPGETVDFFVVLQNVAGEGGDVNVQGLLTEGGDIARLTGDSQEYFVPFGEKRNVNLSVTIPANTTIGGMTNVVVSFKIIAGEGSDALGLGSSIERTIPVKIVAEAPEKTVDGEGISIFVWLLFAVAVAVIFWSYKRRSK